MDDARLVLRRKTDDSCRQRLLSSETCFSNLQIVFGLVHHTNNERFLQLLGYTASLPLPTVKKVKVQFNLLTGIDLQKLYASKMKAFKK